MARDPNYRKYETVFILRTDLTDDEKEKAFAKVDSILKDFDGHPVRREDWGPRKLAYKVKKQTKGNYFYQLYLGKGDLVRELERNFRLMDSVLKFMTVTVEENVVLADFDFAGEAAELTWMAEQRGAKAAAAREEESYTPQSEEPAAEEAPAVEEAPAEAEAAVVEEAAEEAPAEEAAAEEAPAEEAAADEAPASEETEATEKDADGEEAESKEEEA